MSYVGILLLGLALWILRWIVNKILDKLVWPKVVDRWEGLTDQRKRKKIAQLEQVLKDAETEYPENLPLEIKISDRLEWKIASGVHDLQSARLRDNLDLYTLAFIFLLALWKPLASFPGATTLWWSIAANLLTIYVLNVVKLVGLSKRYERNRPIRTSGAKRELRERIESLKATLK